MNRGRIASGGAPAQRFINLAQQFSSQAVAQKITPINLAQAFTATAVATKGLVSSQFDLDPSKNITLSTTMRLTGTSSAMSLAAGTGSLTYASSPPAYLITVEPGATTFSIAYDGSIGTNKVTGISIPFSSTYTVPVGKPGAGNVFTWGASAVAGDTYEGAIASMVTADSGAYTLSQATAANQLVLGQDATGYYLKCVGGSHTLECATAGVVALGTDDAALEVMFKIAPTTAAATGDMFAFCNSASTNNARRFGQVVTGTGRLSCVATNNAGSTTGSNVTRAADDLAPNGTMVKASWRFVGSGGAVTSSVNDANNLSPGNWTPTTPITPNRLAVGGTHDNAFRRLFNGKIYRLVLFSSVLATSDRTAWFNAL